MQFEQSLISTDAVPSDSPPAQFRWLDPPAHELQKALLNEMAVNRYDARTSVLALLDVESPRAGFEQNVLRL
jgi:hypothetical protein